MAKHTWATGLWTTAEVAKYLGISVATAYSTIPRLGIEPVQREPGKRGQNLYDADEVQRKHLQRPGRGNWGPHEPRETGRDDHRKRKA